MFQYLESKYNPSGQNISIPPICIVLTSTKVIPTEKT